MSVNAPADAIARLRNVDAEIEAAVGTPRSLAPGRVRATPLADLVEGVVPNISDVAVVPALVDGLTAIVRAQLRHFPETIFWDFDFVVGELVVGPVADDPVALSRLCEEIAQLQAQYGRHSTLAFRYTHDFTYGYDWTKWVEKAPAERRGVRPFDPRFVAYLRQRGEELVELIANDDEKYPKLPDGRLRNSFGFSREPEHEARLFTALAADGMIPVETWRIDATPRADRPFAEIRETLARKLRIPCNEIDSS